MEGFDPSYILTAIPELLVALPTVIIIFVGSIIPGMIIGLLFTVVRIKKIPVLSQVVAFFISFLRGTPQIVQLFIVYYGIPQVLRQLGLNVSGEDRILYVVITFTFNSAAAFSEAFRSSYLAVDRGQIEAAYSIGMTPWQMFQKVLFPQAFKVVLPNLGNLAVRVLQATSLAFTIGVIDLMGRAKIINNWTFGVNRLAIYIAVSLIYWAICLALELLESRLEKAFSFGHVSLARAKR